IYPLALHDALPISDMQPSIHQVPDAKLYEESLLEGFREYYDLDTAVIWGYTPGYAENPHSSLIYMIQTLIGQDQQGLSRFLPLDKPLDKDAVEEIEKDRKSTRLNSSHVSISYAVFCLKK